ncbi:MAG: DciA family protein [Bacteroidota bacterium]
MGPLRRTQSNPQPIGNVFDQLFRQLGLTRRLHQYDVVAQWKEIVGEQIAQVSEATRVENGVLFVHVKSSAWRNELLLRKQEILARIQLRFRGTGIHDIHFL